MVRRATWPQYQGSIGDRSDLFGAVARRWSIARALYPGSYVDLSPATAISHVTYVDLDKRAAAYFADAGATARDLGAAGSAAEVAFLHADYTDRLPLPDAHFDLLISLYAGPVSEHCRRYLAPGGLLLANASHGDASLAALNDAWQFVAAVQHRGDRYRLDEAALESYLVPKRPERADANQIRAAGRGIAYTRKAFAYIFRLIGT